ncbi:MAG: 5-formyltetrahydrofolate cyclo-ligase [Candidatus Omnitrophica bacterium]|nr:5-formyltetrahydrofolate cyclo-ligase [Candidatus Omnitrophota bacterium]
MQTRLKQHSRDDVISKSLKIKEITLRSTSVEQARVILAYAATPAEVETRDLILSFLKEGKIVALPCCDREKMEITPVSLTHLESLQRGSVGIWEPPQEAARVLDPLSLDLVLVPGIAFDKRGNRLGRGLGYYDRFLRKLGPKTLKIGLGFDFQIVDRVPVNEAWDVPLDRVITN